MSVPCVVGRNGVIEVLGRRYWAPELTSKVGWQVELHFERDDELYPHVYMAGRTQRLCGASLIADSGFLSPDAARETAAKRRDRRASVVRFQVAESLRILDERFQGASKGAKPLCSDSGHHGQRGVMRRLRDTWHALFHDGELSGQQAAHGVDLDLQKLQALFLHSEALFDSHSVAPVVEDDSEPTAADSAVHRLSQGEK